jgi:hypothetical protein
MRFFLLLFCCVLVACPKHVELNVPDADAPESERVAAYLKLQPIEFKRVPTGGYAGEAEGFFLNGNEIFYLEDLLPAVTRNSPTAIAVRECEYHGQKTKRWLRTVGVTFLSALVVGVPGGFLLASPRADTNDGVAVLGKGMIGVGVVSFLFTAFVAMPITVAHANRQEKPKEAAFINFDESLRLRLNLCKDGSQIVDCSKLATPKPATSLAVPSSTSSPVLPALVP